MTAPLCPTPDERPVTVKLDRDVVARLASLKVVRGKRSYSEVLREILAVS